MKFGLIILAVITLPIIVIPSNHFILKNIVIKNNSKPYYQPLPQKTVYHAQIETPIYQKNQIITIDPIITYSDDLSY